MSTQATSPLDVDAIRADFPVLERAVHGEPLVYLDNAATSQKPQSVIDAVSECYEEYNANVHRGMHKLSQEASEAFEATHDRIAAFVGAAGREEVALTRNTTEAINTVAFGWAMEHVEADDAIVLTEMEHHSNLVPWQQVAGRTGAELRFLPVDEDGRVDETALDDVITDDVAVVAVTHMSNVFGTITPAAAIAERAHEVGALAVLDAAQSAPHVPLDLEELGVDFLALSGHKMCGPTGTGALVGREERFEEMAPFEYGGEMIKKVWPDDATWADLPWKFEAGTPHVAGAIGLTAAIDYLEDVGMGAIHEHERAVTDHALELLADAGDVDVYGPPPGAEDRGGVISFNVADAHAHDTADILDDAGVATRSGHHCAQPLMERMGVPATARASFYLYNTMEEAEAFVEAIEDVKEVFAR